MYCENQTLIDSCYLKNKFKKKKTPVSNIPLNSNNTGSWYIFHHSSERTKRTITGCSNDSTWRFSIYMSYIINLAPILPYLPSILFDKVSESTYFINTTFNINYLSITIKTRHGISIRLILNYNFNEIIQCDNYKEKAYTCIPRAHTSKVMRLSTCRYRSCCCSSTGLEFGSKTHQHTYFHSQTKNTCKTDCPDESSKMRKYTQ